MNLKRMSFKRTLFLACLPLFLVAAAGYLLKGEVNACEAPSEDKEVKSGASCTLNPPDMTSSLAQMSVLAKKHLDGVETRATARFKDLRAEDISQLEALVAQESSCCAFLAIHLDVQGEAATLQVSTRDGRGAKEFQMLTKLLRNAQDSRAPSGAMSR